MGKVAKWTSNLEKVSEAHSPVSCTGRQRPGLGEANRRLHGKGADIHLVMNVFNRMLGESGLDDAVRSEQIFGLADYLRLSLTYAPPMDIALDDGLALLDSYLRLTAVFRAWTLDHGVTIDSSAKGTRFQAHDLCLIAQAVLCAYSVNQQGHWMTRLHVMRRPSGVLAIDFTLQPATIQPPVRRALLTKALNALCLSMSHSSRPWRHLIRRSTKPGLAVQVLIG